MNIIKAIKTNKDYSTALSKLEKLFDANPGTKEGDEAELLVILIQDYERNHFPIPSPTPVEAIKFRMEQLNLRQADLAKYLGSESRVSEILNGRRALTVNMIAALHKELGIPLESLIGGKLSGTRRKARYTSYSGKALIAREPNATYSKKKKK